MALGVPNAQIQLDIKAANTSGSAANMRALLGEQSFYLVTPAGHMPRSIAVFRKQGLRPIPAPTDYHVPKNIAQANWSPSSPNLYFSDAAMREHVGTLWYRLTGRI